MWRIIVVNCLYQQLISGGTFKQMIGESQIKGSPISLLANPEVGGQWSGINNGMERANALTIFFAVEIS